MESEHYYTLTTTELTISFGVTSDIIVKIVEEAIVTPKTGPIEQWQFDDSEVRRIRIALQLIQDLGVNLAGAALALDLLDEIDRLHHR